MATLTRMVGFVTTTNPEEAKSFYGGKLGFRFMGDDDFALVFDANGTMLRVGKGRSHTPAQGTILGWQVNDIDAAVDDLVSRGIAFEQFNLAFMKQEPNGVWNAPGGDRVAWFKDPDGNVLSISQHVHSV
jgi:catechol 2,3-dioxygenase-like lactoylglutathione lyase family enzyme